MQQRGPHSVVCYSLKTALLFPHNTKKKINTPRRVYSYSRSAWRVAVERQERILDSWLNGINLSGEQPEEIILTCFFFIIILLYVHSSLTSHLLLSHLNLNLSHFITILQLTHFILTRLSSLSVYFRGIYSMITRLIPKMLTHPTVITDLSRNNNSLISK